MLKTKVLATVFGLAKWAKAEEAGDNPVPAENFTMRGVSDSFYGKINNHAQDYH
jgi:hypothetical protein